MILFQDGKQRRYVSTVDYNIKKLFDERELTDKVLGFHIEEPGLVLHCSEHTELKPENLQAFQRIPESEEFSDEYQKCIREKLLSYYSEHTRAEEADNYLRQMDYKKYAAVDRTALLEVLISRGMYQQAMSIVSQFGYEGIRIESQLKLTSRMLKLRCLFSFGMIDDVQEDN